MIYRADAANALNTAAPEPNPCGYLRTMATRPPGVPWVVLDSTVLSARDRYLESTAGRLLLDETAAGRARIAVPEVVLIEAEAAHRREVKQEQDRYVAAREALRRLRAPQSDEDLRPRPSYRKHVETILKDAGSCILPIPEVPHLQLVHKAANRHGPFDDSGGGYRDALVWEMVLELLGRSVEPVMLVSGDRRAFCQSKDQPELATDLVVELRERGHAGRVRLHFDLKAVTAEIPRVKILAGRWRHTIADDPEPSQALKQELVEIAYADASPTMAFEVLGAVGNVRAPRFVSFARPRDLDLQEAWVSETGSVLFDVAVTVDYTIEFQTLLPSAPPPESKPWDWTTARSSSSVSLTFEVIQHDPRSEPAKFTARLLGWSDPNSHAPSRETSNPRH